MRRRLPRCPFCRGRMLPQARENGWFVYVCEKCEAVSPKARSFGQALDKADARMEHELVWFNRENSPLIDGEYLCEYVYRIGNEPDSYLPRKCYGIRRFFTDDMAFDSERDNAMFGKTTKILRWSDFRKTTGNDADLRETATQDLAREKERRNSETADRAIQ